MLAGWPFRRTCSGTGRTVRLAEPVSMTECVTELEGLAADLATHDRVEAAWLAKSFEDRVLFVEVATDEPLPAAVDDRVRKAGLVGANRVYDLASADSPAFAGRVGKRDQYRFVDVRDRTAQTAPI